MKWKVWLSAPCVPSFLAGSIDLQVGDFAVAVKRPQFALYFGGEHANATREERNQVGLPLNFAADRDSEWQVAQLHLLLRPDHRTALVVTTPTARVRAAHHLTPHEEDVLW